MKLFQSGNAAEPGKEDKRKFRQSFRFYLHKRGKGGVHAIRKDAKYNR